MNNLFSRRKFQIVRYFLSNSSILVSQTFYSRPGTRYLIFISIFDIWYLYLIFDIVLLKPVIGTHMTYWYPLGHFPSLIIWHLPLLENCFFAPVVWLAIVKIGRIKSMGFCRVTKALNNFYEGWDSSMNKLQRMNIKFGASDVLIYWTGL